MWGILNSKVRLWLLVIPSVLLFLFYYQLFDRPFISSLTYTVTSLTFLALGFGKYAWKWIYFSWLEENICPNFNGRWIGTISSNYNGGTVVTFPIEIKADFFTIKMTANTTVGRTYANYCRIIRTTDDKFELSYIFQGYNNNQTETDTSYYDGAAKVIVDDVKTMKMTGLFWTNRCWNKNENTAGTISFEKE